LGINPSVVGVSVSPESVSVDLDISLVAPTVSVSPSTMSVAHGLNLTTHNISASPDSISNMYSFGICRKYCFD
jgi:hypothetical protein